MEDMRFRLTHSHLPEEFSRAINKSSVRPMLISLNAELERLRDVAQVFIGTNARMFGHSNTVTVA
jgi:hypothetical protein